MMYVVIDAEENRSSGVCETSVYGPFSSEAEADAYALWLGENAMTCSLQPPTTSEMEPDEADLDYAYGVHGGSIVGGPICQCSNPNVPGCPRHGHKIDCPF